MHFLYHLMNFFSILGSTYNLIFLISDNRREKLIQTVIKTRLRRIHKKIQIGSQGKKKKNNNNNFDETEFA